MYETGAKVRGFWVDSKNLGRFLSELLRQVKEIATEWRNVDGRRSLDCARDDKGGGRDDKGGGRDDKTKGCASLRTPSTNNL